MKNTILALISLAGLASAATLKADIPVYSDDGTLNVVPFINSALTLTDSGLKYPNNAYTPNGYEFGYGLNAGVLLYQHHEISISSGYTKWSGPHDIDPGIANARYTAEQVPLLLNYFYHLNLDDAGRFTLFAGPSLGLIHETDGLDVVKFASSYVGVTGSSSDSAWKFAGGATIGINAKVYDGWTVGLTAQLLEVAGSTYNFFGYRVHEKTATRPSFALTLGYTF